MRSCFIAGLAVGLFLLLPSLAAAAQEPGQIPNQPPNQEPSQEPAQQPDASATPTPAVRAPVHGIVRNSVTGEPLARALVQIEGDAETGTLTDGEGRFEIPDVPLGPQTIRVVKPGFRDRPYATEETGSQADGPAHSVLVTEQMPELAFALAPDCAIRGHIELSSGDPATGITVVLLKQVIRLGRAVWTLENSARANGDGAYRFGGLSDGVYVVYTQPTLESEPAVSVVATGSAANVARSGYPAVFYPDARDLAGAQRIRVSGGAQADANFTLVLEPFYPVTAVDASQNRATATGRAEPRAGYIAGVMDGSAHLLPYSAQYDENTHSVQANLPDGTYVLVLRGFSRPDFQGDVAHLIGRNGERPGALAGEVQFTVAGHPVIGLRVPLGPPPPATVRLRLIHSPDNPAPAITSSNAMDLVALNLDPADGIPPNGFDNVWSMENGADSITFTAQPGSYWLSAYLPRKGLCAGALSAGGANLAREPITFSLDAAPPPMDLAMRDDCATLALTLPPALASFLPGEEPFYTVYVVPDFDTLQDIPPMTVHPSSGPTLTVDSLVPGSYHVYTFDSPVHLEYRNSAVLAALPTPGQAVTLTAATTSSLALEVPAQ
jgi:carboxypeptidase family protein